jgi:hypothetical protein
MFIYSIKANTIKLVAVIGAALIALTVMILLIPDYSPKTTAAIAKKIADYKYDKIRNNDDRVSFLKQFGWEVEEGPEEEVKLRIPSDFDKVMNSYNELQKQGGLDLSKYRGKEVTRYTYKVTNYPGYDGTVLANVIIYKNRVVGGDVCSSDVSGFIGTFEYPETDGAGKPDGAAGNTAEQNEKDETYPETEMNSEAG